MAALPPRGYEQSYGIWSGEDFLPVLEKELGLTEGSISFYEVSVCMKVKSIVLALCCRNKSIEEVYAYTCR